MGDRNLVLSYPGEKSDPKGDRITGPARVGWPSGSLLRNCQIERYPFLFSWVAVSILYYPPGVLRELLQAQGIDQTFLNQALGGEHGGGAVRASAQGRVQEHELLNLL